jgi:hypothetical protein
VEIGVGLAAVAVEDVVAVGVDRPSDARVALLRPTESVVADVVLGWPKRASSSLNWDVKDAIWFSCAGVVLLLNACVMDEGMSEREERSCREFGEIDICSFDFLIGSRALHFNLNSEVRAKWSIGVPFFG